MRSGQRIEHGRIQPVAQCSAQSFAAPFAAQLCGEAQNQLSCVERACDHVIRAHVEQGHAKGCGIGLYKRDDRAGTAARGGFEVSQKAQALFGLGTGDLQQIDIGLLWGI